MKPIDDPVARTIAELVCAVFDHPLEDWHELQHLGKLLPLVAAKRLYDEQRKQFPVEEPKTTWGQVCGALGLDPDSALRSRRRYESKAAAGRAKRRANLSET